MSDCSPSTLIPNFQFKKSSTRSKVINMYVVDKLWDSLRKDQGQNAIISVQEFDKPSLILLGRIISQLCVSLEAYEVCEACFC